jgi:glutamate-1-semialdehyde 2,1-aminomutase
MEIDNSNLLKEKANRIIPHQTGTFSSAASHFVEGVYPVYAKKANGCKFVDVDDNEYVDYLMGLGPITLGYNYESVNKAIIEQLNEGILFSLPHPKEVELSELIIKTIPHAEMVKLEKTGSNAVTGAVRAARALTKREKIAYCGSGGVWHDWQAAMVSRDGGVPSFNNELIKIFDYNDNEGLEQIFDDNPNEISCIVLEPTIYEKPTKTFLKQVRKICDDHNSILILDEIVTGFRFHLQGAQKFFDIKGDFVCFGKGLGNGLPISAITGPTEFMKIFNELWVSSTNNREMLSIAGTIATINEMKEKQTIDHCWKLGEIFLNEWNKICVNYNIDAKLFGYPVRMMMKCFDTNKIESKSLKSLILQEMIKKGHFISPGPIFLSYSHTKEDISNTLDSFENVCKFISTTVLNDQYEKFLEGSMPKTIWTMKIPTTKKPI